MNRVSTGVLFGIAALVLVVVYLTTTWNEQVFMARQTMLPRLELIEDVTAECVRGSLADKIPDAHRLGGIVDSRTIRHIALYRLLGPDLFPYDWSVVHDGRVFYSAARDATKDCPTDPELAAEYRELWVKVFGEDIDIWYVLPIAGPAE